MQILKNLDAIPYKNALASDIDFHDVAWREFERCFGYQLKGINFDFRRAQKLFSRDTSEIPPRELREGYYDDNHLAYWMSGLIDASKLQQWGISQIKKRKPKGKIFDLGCSTGRVLRHLEILYPEADLWGADINSASIQWGQRFLPPRLQLFCNSTRPNLPFSNNDIEVIAAFSVFSHIEKFEEEWLLEMRRLLRPGGILFLTLNTDSVWGDIAPGHPLYENFRTSDELPSMDFKKPMPREKIIFHSHNSFGAYEETVVHSRNYVENNWAPLFQDCLWYSRGHDFQDVVILKK